MNIKIREILNNTAKIIFAAAVLASFIFIGWRIASRQAYAEHEEAQCRAFAVSAALTAAEELSKGGTLADMIRSQGRAEFITDHMKTPGNFKISVMIESDGDGFILTSAADSGWNSRVLKHSEVRSVLRGKEISFEEKDDLTDKIISAREETPQDGSDKKYLFTFSFERPCPAPFYASAEKVSGITSTPVYIFLNTR